ncbi:hypothetical protein C8J57DRAFT_1311864 [Mycena rebaudengoi]|nr:hypothetical protein C8J57DRAFT_1311864 [Mycena rebaudengoi]
MNPAKADSVSMNSSQRTSIVGLLSRSLSDPNDPAACCLAAISLALDILVGGGGIDPADQGLILRGIMKFLTRPQSEAEHALLRKHLLTCSCDLTDRTARSLHNQSTDTSAQTFDRAIHQFSSHLVLALGRRNAGQFQSRKKNLRPPDQPWPLDPADLYSSADGCRGMLHSLLRWCASTAEGYSIFMLVGELAKFYDPFAREVFRHPYTFALATRHLQTAVDIYDAGTFFISLPEYLGRSLMGYKVLIAGCSFTDSPKTMATLSRIRGPINKLASRMYPVLNRATQPEDFRLFTMLRGIGAPVAREIPDIQAGRQYEVVLDSMNALRGRNFCMHVTCMDITTTQTTLCTRCGTIRYCNATCQRAAWRTGSVPHKALCDLVNRLRTQLELKDPDEWRKWVDGVIRPPSEEFPFTTLCHAKGVSQDLILGIYNEIGNLTTLRDHDDNLKPQVCICEAL